MVKKRKTSIQISRLAADLGLRADEDPVKAILYFCEKKVKGFLSEMGECKTLSEFLNWVANRLGTTFKIIFSDEDLQSVKAEFLGKGEKAFVNLERDLSDETFGITYRRLQKLDWEPPFVSIIDCRGEKGARAYFTKWHEIAHLLTLTQQMRLQFRRTHPSVSGHDPEEQLMDLIAGRFGFYEAIFKKSAAGRRITFDEIDRLRLLLCPEASMLASLINFAKNWPSPCILLRCELGLNTEEERSLVQNSFDFIDVPQPVLRAVKVTVNDAAREANFQLFENMRIPEDSIIQTIFTEKLRTAESDEELSAFFKTTKRSQPANILARYRDYGVDALISLRVS